MGSVKVDGGRCIAGAKIEEFIECDKIKFAHLYNGDPYPGGWRIRLDALYATRKEAEDAMMAKSEVLKEKYRSEINSVQKLLQFVFEHTMTLGTNGEPRAEPEAREVVIEKAKEYGMPISENDRKDVCL